MRKAFPYRLRFSKPGEDAALNRFAGCCRFVWNKALSLQKDRLDSKKRILSYPEMAALLLAWKEEHPFLKEAPSQALQQRLMDLDKAFHEAFDPRNPKRFPSSRRSTRAASRSGTRRGSQ
ncbi:MAG TPA: helix-turn-helix domain-containing protein [Nitrospirota bacterium]|nr:helix-turn-helix domain-containing protein [Nitrospirota bacterium]